jgi:hypothetical protein
MVFLAFLFFFAFIIYIQMGIYALRFSPKSLLNRMFFILCILFAFWSIDNIQFNLIKVKEFMLLHHKGLAFAWCFFPGVTLHFFLILTKKNRLLQKWWTYLMLYLPGLVFIVMEITGLLMHKDFIPYQYGWKAIYNLDSISYWAYQFYYAGYVLICIFLTWHWGRKTTVLRKKKQAKIIVLSSLLSVRDDGVGFPEGLDYQKAKSLGLKLVNNLAKQLSGNLELIRGNGSEFKVTFSELIYKERG